jgi:hypothetical protein
MATRSYCGILDATNYVMAAVKNLKFNLMCAVSCFILTNFTVFHTKAVHTAPLMTKCLSSSLSNCKVLAVMFARLRHKRLGLEGFFWSNFATVSWAVHLPMAFSSIMDNQMQTSPCIAAVISLCVDTYHTQSYIKLLECWCTVRIFSVGEVK